MKRERMTNPKCLGRAIPDTFSARSADLTDLKMRRITRGASFDHLVGAAGYGLYVFAPAGRRTVKTEPLPGSLVTVTSPPSAGLVD